MVSFAAAYLRGFVRKEEGQDLVEYALLVALIAIAAVSAIGVASGSINNVFQGIAGELETAPTP